jgi:Flp pilus assembly protein TadG
MRRKLGDRGSMAVEFVVAAPALVLLLLIVAGGGQWLDINSQVGAAARDAVRSASVDVDYTQAVSDAQAAAAADLGGACEDGGPSISVQPGADAFADATNVNVPVYIKVTVTCVASLSAFADVGFAVSQTFSDTAVAALDPYSERSSS